MSKKPTKEAILEAIKNPRVKSVTDICKYVGVGRTTFYFHYNKDLKFRQKYLEGQKEKLEKEIETFN